MSVKILTGDMRELLAQVPDASADCILTDPPYGETSLTWDRWPTGWLSLVRPKLKKTGSMWVFGSQRMFFERAVEFAGWSLAQDIVWEKHNGAGFFADRFRRVHELALHFYRDDAPWSGVYKAPQYTNDAMARTVRRKGRPAHWTGERGDSVFRSEDGGPPPDAVGSVRQIGARAGAAPDAKAPRNRRAAAALLVPAGWDCARSIRRQRHHGSAGSAARHVGDPDRRRPGVLSARRPSPRRRCPPSSQRSRQMLVAPVQHIDTIDRATLNRLLVAWGHRMGPYSRPAYAVEAHHAMFEHGEPVAVAAAGETVREVVGQTGIRREQCVELIRLCAARPGLCRPMLRLWREMLFPAIAAAHGRTLAVSYQDEALHTGDLYRFDGWQLIGRGGGGGTDARTGRAGRRMKIWAWPPDAARSLLAPSALAAE